MHKPIYLALDFEDFNTADAFLTKHDLTDIPVKVGMELFYKEGPDVVKKLRARNQDVFLDLKLHDIPTTVYKAMKNIATLDVQITNVHALGAGEMIRRAKEGLVEGSNKSVADLIAVTLLTSHSEKTVREELHLSRSIDDSVLDLATLAKANGADGVVCSALEVPRLKQRLGEAFLTVTPGIRLVDSEHDDQQRVATPALAKQNGADYLVIGRSITQSSDPKKQYLKALEAYNRGE